MVLPVNVKLTGGFLYKAIWHTDQKHKIMIKHYILNPLKTSPKYTQAGVYGECVLKQNLPIFNGLILNWS